MSDCGLFVFDEDLLRDVQHGRAIKYPRGYPGCVVINEIKYIVCEHIDMHMIKFNDVEYLAKGPRDNAWLHPKPLQYYGCYQIYGDNAMEVGHEIYLKKGSKNIYIEVWW